jgi:hypothetical protein
MSVRDSAMEIGTGGLEVPPTVLDAPRPISRRRGRAALGGLLLSGLLIALCSAHTPSFLPETIRPAPSSLAGVFAPLGLDLHVGGAIALLVVMFASYAAVTRLVGDLSPTAVIVAIVVLDVLVLLGPPLISTDIFSYQAYARMGADYGVNPYLNGPHAIALDHIFPYVGADWSYIPSAYGPVFTVFSYALAGLSIAASVVAYKAIAVVAALGIVALIWRCARLRRLDPTRAIALVGLNPLFVVYGIGGGHNDVLMLLCMTAACWAFLEGRRRGSGALTLLAIGVKLTAGLMLPFAIAAEGPSRPREHGSALPEIARRRRGLLAGAGAGLVAIAILSVVVFGGGSVLHVLATVRQSQSEGDWKSIPGAIGDRLGLPTVGSIVGDVLAMLIASSSFLPWYVTWLLPFAALGHSRRLRGWTLAMSGIVLGIQLLGYIPHG